MTTTMLNSGQRQALLEKILALRQLTQETSMKTNRSQTQLLTDLCPDDLTFISVELKRHRETFGW
jgi:hypothetical protein